MKTAKPAAKTPPTGILFIVLLVVILAALFSEKLFAGLRPFFQRWTARPGQRQMASTPRRLYRMLG